LPKLNHKYFTYCSIASLSVKCAIYFRFVAAAVLKSYNVKDYWLFPFSHWKANPFCLQ